MPEKKIYIFDKDERRFTTTTKTCSDAFPGVHIFSHQWYLGKNDDPSENDHPSNNAVKEIRDDIEHSPAASRLVITNIAGIQNGFLQNLRDVVMPSLTCIVTTCWSKTDVNVAIAGDPAFRNFETLGVSIVHSLDPSPFYSMIRNFYVNNLRAALEALPSDNPFHLEK